MRKNDNTAQFNMEALSEQEMNAYLSMVEEDTPDLWDRIEDGFAKEAGKVKNSENNKVTSITSRKIRRKYVGIIAACVFAVVIAIPVLGGALGGRNKSDNYVAKDSDNVAYQEECSPTEAPNEEAVEDGAAVNGAGQDNPMSDITANEPVGDSNALTQDAAENAAENTEPSIGKYIMVEDAVYEYGGVYVNNLPDGYALIGMVESVDSAYPDENFEGTCLEIGQNIYGSSSEEGILYIEADGNGYEKFIKK